MSVPKIVVPLCSRCRRLSVLDPCRRCASDSELEDYPAVDIEPAQAKKEGNA